MQRKSKSMANYRLIVVFYAFVLIIAPYKQVAGRLDPPIITIKDEADCAKLPPVYNPYKGVYDHIGCGLNRRNGTYHDFWPEVVRGGCSDFGWSIAYYGPCNEYLPECLETCEHMPDMKEEQCAQGADYDNTYFKNVCSLFWRSYCIDKTLRSGQILQYPSSCYIPPGRGKPQLLASHKYGHD